MSTKYKPFISLDIATEVQFLLHLVHLVKRHESNKIEGKTFTAPISSGSSLFAEVPLQGFPVYKGLNILSSVCTK